MPLHTSLITAGAGSSIPITGGAATSGDAFSGASTINIGGLFGSGAKSKRSDTDTVLPAIIIGVVIIVIAVFFRRR